jgi:LmbE family N-acetylglucosaminyl deacetylase
MQFHKSTADLFIPDGLEEGAALSRTTHLCIAAHQDDIEIMAYHGIAECFGRKDRWFTGVVVTNGAGSPRSGIYGAYSDEEMQRVRLIEQRKAAYVGEYAAQAQLGFSSAEVKNAASRDVVEDIEQILRATQPEVVYLHWIGCSTRTSRRYRFRRDRTSRPRWWACSIRR